MRMISICTHPIHGRCFLWEKSPMNYRLGKGPISFMKFDGWTLDEVFEKIATRGFKILSWDTTEEFRP